MNQTKETGEEKSKDIPLLSSDHITQISSPPRWKTTLKSLAKDQISKSEKWVLVQPSTLWKQKTMKDISNNGSEESKAIIAKNTTKLLNEGTKISPNAK